jgi:hypothetical protein
MIGNEVGIAAVDKVNETLLGTVVTDGANLFTVTAAEFRNFRVGQIIDMVTAATGATGPGALGRTVTALDSATNSVTYSGGDLTLTTSQAAYLTGQWEPAQPAAIPAGGGREDYANINGGVGVGTGFDNINFGSIDAMRARLTAISATTYSATELDKMTMNDMIYAIRVNDMAGSIKG